MRRSSVFKPRASAGRQSSEGLVSPPAAPSVSSYASVPIRVHNRTSLDLIAVSVVAALASSSTVTSSSINAYTTHVPMRNTPVPVPPHTLTDLPQTELEPSTAASNKGYVIDLTILGRGAPTSTALFASISAIAPTSKPSPSKTEVSSGVRTWKKLDLIPSSTDGHETEKSALAGISALQSIPAYATDPIQILVLPTRDAVSWMTTLPDHTLLSALCIPGTHESCALFGWPISACQESISTVTDQLSKGVRFLDIRLALKSQKLWAYHGVTDEKLAFSAILDQVYAFLAQQPSETVIMSVKQENAAAEFEAAVIKGHVAAAPGKWYTGTRVPTLAQSRGKIVLLSRFGGSEDQPGGIHPPVWPDSSPTIFTYDLPNDRQAARQSVMTQDWYGISSLSSIPDKMTLISTLIAQCGDKPYVLGLNFTNAASFPRALPALAAKGIGDQTKPAQHCWQVTGINALLVDLVADRLQLRAPSTSTAITASGLANVFAMDFFDQPGLGADLTRLLIEANFT